MFLTIKNVRRETLLRELKENLLEMVSDNVIRINGVQFSNLNHLILCSFSHTMFHHILVKVFLSFMNFLSAESTVK